MKQTILTLIGILLLWGCQGNSHVPSSSHIWFRCEANEWQRSAEWEFEDKGNGKYALYDKDLCLDFLIDVKSAGKWNFRMWGGNDGDSLIVPNVPYQLGREWQKCVQCGYEIIHCDSIVLIANDNKRDATITLYASQAPQAFSVLEDTTINTRTTHHNHGNTKLQVLVVGNSLSGFNNQDSMIISIANQNGKDIMVKNRWKGGASLKTHWNMGLLTDIYGNPSASSLIYSQSWTHIVLQDFSLRPLYDPEGFGESVHKWVNFIRNYSPNHDAEIFLVTNWPRAFLWDDYIRIYNLIAHNSRIVANREGITLCPVGDA